MSPQRRQLPQNTLTKLLHTLITASQKGYAIYQDYSIELAAHGLPVPSYDSFAARLRGDGHGTLAIDDLPVLCRAMRRCGIDTNPVTALLVQQCAHDLYEHTDGDLNDELLDLLDRAGDIARRAKDSTLTNLSNSELQRLRALCGQILIIAGRMNTECAKALVA